MAERGVLMSKKTDFNLRTIKMMAELIKEKFAPQKIILFGSYAYGKTRENSDIDLLIIMNTKMKPYKQASIIRLSLDEILNKNYPIDIIVRTPEEVEKRIKEGDFFFKGILEKGVPL